MMSDDYRCIIVAEHLDIELIVIDYDSHGTPRSSVSATLPEREPLWSWSTKVFDRTTNASSPRSVASSHKTLRTSSS